MRVNNQRKTQAAKISPSTNSMETIGVVGAGLCGLMQVIDLLEEFAEVKKKNRHAGLSILWFSKTETFGPGAAYGQNENIVYLGSPAKEMSPFRKDPNHFVRWLRQEFPNLQYDENSYATRATYNKYLRSVAQSLITKAYHEYGVALTPLVGEVSSIQPEPGNDKPYAVCTGTTKVHVHQFVAAIGHDMAQDPFGGLLDKGNRYFRVLENNAKQNKLEAFRNAIPTGQESKDKTIAIVGLGPTAVDWLRRLEQQGYQGKIVIISRHTALPWPRDPKLDGKQHSLGFTHDDVLTLAKVFESGNGQDQEGRPSKRAVVDKFHNLIAREVQSAIDENTGPQNFLNGQALLEILGNAEINKVSPQFVKAAYGVVSRFKVNPTPPQDYELIQNLLQGSEPRLVIEAGNVSSAIFNKDKGSGKITISYDTQPQSLENPITLAVDYVLDGSPYAYDYRGNKFLQQLCDAGLTTFDRVLDHNGKPSGRIVCTEFGESQNHEGGFFLGPFAKPAGLPFSTWGLETFRHHCSLTTQKLFENLNHRMPQAKPSRLTQLSRLSAV